MKTLKNDTRYIIKKVIIGVLIAIVLFNARKCGVYAETIELSNISASNRCSPVNLIYTYDIGGNSRWSCASTSFQVSRTLSYSNTTLYYDTYNIKNYANVGSGTYNVKYFVLYDTTNDYYIIQNSSSNNFSTNTLIFNSVNNYLDMHFSSGSGSLVPSTIISNHSMTFTNDNNAYTLSNYNNEIYSYNLSNISLSDLDLSHTYIYDTNIEGLSLIIDNQIIQEYSLFPPSGYSEIDLTGYQGVVFVPKNYSDIECSVVGDLCNTTFNYYYQNEIKEAYFPLDNHFDLRFNLDILNSPDEPIEKSTYFPISQEISESSSNNIGRIYNMYYAFMIYNYTNDGSPLDPLNQNAYGGAKVWYDSTKWNYYLVEDFNSWSQNVCYKVNVEENGVTTEYEQCIDISGLPTLREAIEQAESENYIDPYNGNFLNALFDLLTAPFRLIKEFGSTQCEPITFPLRFPTANQDITLQCLSPTYKQHLGDYYYNLIGSIITALLAYKLALYMIDIVTDILDPKDDKLEAIDL